MADRNPLKKEENEELEIILSKSATSSTDFVNIATRTDNTVFLQLFSVLPDNKIIENHRTVLTVEDSKNLINTLCEIIDYYPSEPKKEKSDSE